MPATADQPRARTDLQLGRELRSFVVVGVLCTLVYTAIYPLLRIWLVPLAANAIALCLTMGVNFALNRRFTYRATGGSLRAQAAGYVVAYLIGLGASSLALHGLLRLLHNPGQPLDTLAALTAGSIATAIRFVLMRTWVFHPRGREGWVEGHRPAGLPLAPAAHGRVDIVLPVHNEEHVLERSVTALVRHLRDVPLMRWQITIADNGSTDGTGAVARRLARRFPEVRALSIGRKGRGGALRTAWTLSDADVVAYMDVDLSTDLAAFAPLVAPLLRGEAHVAIGSRRARGADVERGLWRELLSRGYNVLLRAACGARFSDAQCGFKAVRREAVGPLLELIEDGGWFFDTELLLLAQRNGLGIHEVPVRWVDDFDSRVNIRRTIVEDLRGIRRMRRRFRRGGGLVADPAEGAAAR